MSHELRTPLNAIIGFSQLMHDGKVGSLSAEHEDYIGDILNSGKHLLELINDVLDLSKVEAGRMEVLNSTFAVENVITEVVQNIAPIMSIKELKLIREIPLDLPPITTDKRKLFQILLNLASNAAKFTDHGEIRIHCEIVRGTMRVSVTDTGVGINRRISDSYSSLSPRPTAACASAMREQDWASICRGDSSLCSVGN